MALADQHDRPLSWLVNSIIEPFLDGKLTTTRRE